MKELAGRAKGEILAFTDANTFLAKDALLETARAFSSSDIGGVAGTLLYTNDNESEIAKVNGAYWRYEEFIKRLESRTGSTMGADGAFFAIRQELYTPTPPDIIDDMHTSLNVVLAGVRFVSLSSIKTFEKTPTKSADEFRRKVRIACRAFNCYRLVAPRLHAMGPDIVYRFYSHKVLRWLICPIALVAGACLVAAMVMSGAGIAALALILVGVAIGLLGYLGVKPFATLYEIGISLYAVMLGVIDSLRGRRYQTWTIAKSGR